MTVADLPCGSERPRIVVLGASNVRLGWKVLLRVAYNLFRRPFDAHLVMGHGRSLARRTRFLGVSYTGLLHSVVWDCLQRETDRPTWILLTDIGNDVLYGETADQIVEWAGRIADRGRAMAQSMVVTGLPMASLNRLPAWRYRLLRTVLWPSSQVAYSKALSTAREVDDALRGPGLPEGVALVQPRPDWFGFDPVHVRCRARQAAWHAYLAPWSKSARLACSSDDPPRAMVAINEPRRLPRGVVRTEHYERRYVALRHGVTIRYYVG